MQQLFLVGLGGAIGAMARFEMGRLIGMRAWPMATFFVNLSGSFLMGFITGLLSANIGGQGWRLLLCVGVLGGYTTFSAFSLELALMVERQQWLTAIGYATSSVLGAVVALFLGLWIGRILI